jgi:hypothetical protein
MKDLPRDLPEPSRNWTDAFQESHRLDGLAKLQVRAVPGVDPRDELRGPFGLER